jgi:hypothetical protein
VNFANEGSGSSRSETWTPQLSGIKYTVAGPGGTCGALGTYEGAQGAAITGSYLMKGYKNLAHTEQVGTWVSAATGLFLTGNGSAENPSRLAAENYPAAISGQQGTSLLTFTTAGGKWKCKKADLNGELAGASAELSLDAAYDGCTAFGQNATVTMNSCHYVLHVANAASPYSGSLELACSKAGDAITVNVATGNCSLTVPAQTVGGLTLENAGAGTGAYVGVTVAGEGLAYGVTGPGTVCGVAGSHTDGKLSGAFELRATFGS